MSVKNFNDEGKVKTMNLTDIPADILIHTVPNVARHTKRAAE